MSEETEHVLGPRKSGLPWQVVTKRVCGVTALEGEGGLDIESPP